ncbi:MAG: glucosamine-6-phosphate deaminase [bacterium]
MEIIIVKNYQELSQVAAAIFAAQLQKKKSSVMGLATGNTMVGMYRQLVRAYKQKEISFKKMVTFNLDEFVNLSENHPGTLYAFMRKYFFDKVDVNFDHINFLDCEAIDPKKECRQYEKQLKKIGPIDMQFLGIGTNGHLAWCEPGTSLKSRTSLIDLTLSSREAQLVNFKNISDVPKQGYSMGLATILEAKQIVLMASGADKAEIIAKALCSSVTKDLPASIVQRHNKVTVILDAAAAKNLMI